jgi:Na+-transporting NADH:ubiquinone oxidoreductase subunit B
LIPTLLFGIYNVGLQHYRALGIDATIVEMVLFGSLKVLPIVIVSYAVGLGVEFAYAVSRGHQVNEGYLVTGLLIPLIIPVTTPLWMVALAAIFAVIIGKEAFGGTGMNLLNPALTARAFLFFAYPAYLSGDKVWTDTSLAEGQSLVDGYSGATALGDYAAGQASSFAPIDMFIGTIPGSIGETSMIAILLGAGVLIATGIGSWKIMLSGVIGALVMGIIFNLAGANIFMDVPFWQHLIMGGFAFGIVYMATDPVSAAQTETGKWIYGFLIGFFAILFRVFNPAYPEGIMLSILLMNVFAPLIDHYVVEANIKRRLSRAIA